MVTPPLQCIVFGKAFLRALLNENSFLLEIEKESKRKAFQKVLSLYDCLLLGIVIFFFFIKDQAMHCFR